MHTGFQLAATGFSITDQEVVLARSGVAGFAVTGSEAHTFANQNLFQTPLGALSPQRGYVLVDATLDGVPFPNPASFTFFLCTIRLPTEP